ERAGAHSPAAGHGVRGAGLFPAGGGRHAGGHHRPGLAVAVRHRLVRLHHGGHQRRGQRPEHHRRLQRPGGGGVGDDLRRLRLRLFLCGRPHAADRGPGHAGRRGRVPDLELSARPCFPGRRRRLFPGVHDRRVVRAAAGAPPRSVGLVPAAVVHLSHFRDVVLHLPQALAARPLARRAGWRALAHADLQARGALGGRLARSAPPDLAQFADVAVPVAAVVAGGDPRGAVLATARHADGLCGGVLGDLRGAVPPPGAVPHAEVDGAEKEKAPQGLRQYGMVIFVRSYIADLDARLGKYFKALDTAGLSWRFIGWNKTGAAAAPDSRCDYFERRARLGAGWSNAAALLLWNLYILRQLVRHRARAQVVHAVDLDCALACWLFCALFRRRLVFDIYDKYTAVRNIGGWPGRILDALERRLALGAPLTLLASEERLAQHGIPAGRGNVLVLENVPHVDMPEPAPSPARPPWKIGYFGVLEARHRGLEDLLVVCAGRDDVELHVAGYG